MAIKELLRKYYKMSQKQKKIIKQRCIKYGSISIVTLVIILGGCGLHSEVYRAKLGQDDWFSMMFETNVQRYFARLHVRHQHFIKRIALPAQRIAKHENVRKVPPSVVTAQAIVESNWGTSQLYQNGKNIFGVKGKYQGQSINLPTQEYENGSYVTVNAPFRKYPSFQASIKDHDTLVQKIFFRKVNYDPNYVQGAKLLQRNKYATDPQYANSLIQTIRKYHLQKYDKE